MRTGPWFPAVFRRLMKACALTFLLCLLAGGGLPVCAQQPATPGSSAQARSSISKESVLGLLGIKALNAEQKSANLEILATAIRSNGVDFEVTPAVDQELREA